MDGQAEPARETIEEPIPTLGELLKMSIEERCNWLLEWARPEFEEAIESVRSDFSAHNFKIELPSGMARRVAWAVAYNIDCFLSSENHLKQRPKPNFKWSPSTPWPTIWEKLVLPELTLSVLCEKNSEWQDPASRPIDENRAIVVQSLLMKNNQDKVVNHVKAEHISFRDLAGDIAQEAWERLIKTRWSKQSKSRFHGFCSIYRAIIVVADYVVKSHLRKQKSDPLDRQLMTPEPNESKETTTIEDIEDQRISNNPIEEIQGEQLLKLTKEAIETLPAKRKEVAKIYFLVGMRMSEIAKQKNITKAGVTNHIKESQKHIRKYLQKHGLMANPSH